MDAQIIYFDMDGVLADFMGGVRSLCGMEPPNQNDKTYSKEMDDEMWNRIKNVPNFYDKLEPMPGAIDMFNTIKRVYGDKCEILTGIPKPKRGIVTAGEDKTRWVHRLLGEDIVVNIVLREEKPQYCKGKGCILIDDMEKNIKEWTAMGGIGILHVDVVTTLSVLKEMGYI